MKKYFLLFLLVGVDGYSQWKIIGPRIRPFANRVTTSGQDAYAAGGVFFEQGRIWVSGRGNGTSGADVHVSEDTGKTWRSVSFPFGVGESPLDISFSNANFGIMSTTNGRLYTTFDGGYLWTGTNGGAMHIKAITDKLIVFAGGSITRTADGFNTYQQHLTTDDIYNLHFNNAGIFYCSGSNTFNTSKDSGRTWTVVKNSFLDQDSYSSSSHATCSETIIYIANEDNKGMYFNAPITNKLSDLYVSTDEGKSFTATISTNSPDNNLTGTVFASRHGVAYTSTYSGILRSMDKGKTWQGIGGPGGIVDGASFALISDSTIVGLDSLGNIWMGNFPRLPLPPIIQPLVQGFTLQNISSCDSASSVVKLTHQFCSPLIVTEVFPESSTSSTFTVASKILPDTLLDGKTLTLAVAFDPKKQVGSFSGGVRAKGYYIDDGDTMRIDTVIKFSASSKANGPRLVYSPGYINFDSASICTGGFRDSVITLTNRGCDALSITQGPGVLSPEFTLLSPFATPYTLQKDSSVTLRFRFKPTTKGKFGVTPKFHAEQQGLTQDVQSEFEGTGVIDTGYILTFSAAPFASDSCALCQTLTRKFRVRSGGCVVPRVASQSISGSAMKNYSLDARVPDPLTGDDEVTITFTPNALGAANADYTLTMADGRKLIVPLAARGYKIPYTLAFTPKDLFSRDSLYVLCGNSSGNGSVTISGCPLPKVASENIIGGAASDYLLKTKATDSLTAPYTFDITFTPSAIGKRDAEYTLLFDDGSFVSVPLMGYGLKSVPLPLMLSTDPAFSTDTIGGLISVPIKILGLTIPRELELTVGFDTNLQYLGTTSLAGMSVDIPSSRTKNSSRIHLAPAQVNITGTSAYANFNVFADSGKTMIVSLSDLSVLDAQSPCEFAGNASVAATITGPSGCGIMILSDFLRYHKTPHFAIYPNPTNSTITVSVAHTLSVSKGEHTPNPSQEGNKLEITVTDAVGCVRLTQSNNPIIDLSSLPSGLYFVRVSGYGAALPVVVSK